MMVEFRWRSAFTVVTAALLFGQAAPVAAQTDELCTSTAMRSILSTFPKEMKVDLACDQSFLTDPESTCNSESTTGLEKFEAKLYNSITGACTTPNSADAQCAAIASGQYSGLIRAAGSQGDEPELDPARLECRQTIGLASSKLAKKSASVLRKCNGKALAGTAGFGPAGPSCTDGEGNPQATIARSEEKLRKALFRRCGGPDRAAGGGDDLDPQDALGFAETCRGGPDCVAPVPGLAELADCMICVAAQEVGEATTGALALPLEPVQSCRVVLDRAYTRLAIETMGLRWRCEEEVLEDADAPSCPDESATEDIASEESDAAAEVAVSCGSLDPQDDIGFPATCPDVGACSAIDVNELSGLIECLNCVTAVRTQGLVSSASPVSALEPDLAKRTCREVLGDKLAHGGSGFTRTKILRLQRCDRNRDCGITTDSCPDERATAEIDDRRADASMDFLDACSSIDPQDLGFGATCPDILGCGSQETGTFPGLSACLLCIADATAQDLHDLYSPWP